MPEKEWFLGLCLCEWWCFQWHSWCWLYNSHTLDLAGLFHATRFLFTIGNAVKYCVLPLLLSHFILLPSIDVYNYTECCFDGWFFQDWLLVFVALVSLLLLSTPPLTQSLYTEYTADYFDGVLRQLTMLQYGSVGQIPMIIQLFCFSRAMHNVQYFHSFLLLSELKNTFFLAKSHWTGYTILQYH